MCCGKCGHKDFIGRLLPCFYQDGTIYLPEEEAEAEKIRNMPDDKNRMYLIKGFEVIHGKKFPINTGINFFVATNIPDISIQVVIAGMDFLLNLGTTKENVDQLELDLELT
jgi:hypothetical protein